MTFEEELRALRALNAGLKPVPRQHRARLIRQALDALNREEQKPRPVSPAKLRVVEHIDLAPPPEVA